MRILLVSEDIPYSNMGGLAKHVLNLARALIRAGHTVDILGGDQHPIEVAGKEGEFGGKFFGELNGHLPNWKEVKLGVFMPYRRTWVAKRFARIIMRHAKAYDVVHYHGHAPNVALYISKDINFVQTRHDHGSDCLIDTRFRRGSICSETDARACAGCKASNPNMVQTAVSTIAVLRFRSQVAKGFQRHKTVFVSDMLKRNVAKTFGEQNSWGQTVHNFLDRSSIDNARKLAKTRLSYHENSSPNEFHIFIAAKLYAAKGVEAFLREACQHVRPGMLITIAGDGPDEARLRAEFENEQIKFLGWCSHEKTLQIAACADAIVVPSIWEEPFGSTTLEGVLLGKPTFALALGATPEIAMYAASAGQLRLHKDMPALVRDLMSSTGHVSYPPLPEDIGGAKKIVEQLERIYLAPPGTLPDAVTLEGIPQLLSQRGVSSSG